MLKIIKERIKNNTLNELSFDKDLIPAAILILLFQNQHGQLSTIFQKRSQRVHHPGEISFPGGRFEKADVNLINTALRETQEEIGINASDIDILGPLNPTTTRMGYVMSPFIGYTDQKDIEFVANDEEIERLIEVPLDHLLDPVNQAWITWQGQNSTLTALGFRIDDEIIFGATARVVCEFINLLQ